MLKSDDFKPVLNVKEIETVVIGRFLSNIFSPFIRVHSYTLPACGFTH